MRLRCQMFSFCFLIIIKSLVADAKVYCMDHNATPWMPLGFSCPLRCANIVAVIEKLRMIDYKDIVSYHAMNDRLKLMQKIKNKNENEGNDTKASKHFNNGDTDDIEASSAEREIRRVFRKDRLKTDLEREIRYKTVHLLKNGMCSQLFSGNARETEHSAFSKKMLQRCLITTSNEDDFVTKIMDILNEHASSRYKFTKEMTSMLLKQTLGATVDLRNGVYDIGKVLHGIQKTVRMLKHINTKPKLVVKLASKHCLNIYQPGCFCKKGFVEKSGMCAKPAACLTHPLQARATIWGPSRRESKEPFDQGQQRASTPRVSQVSVGGGDLLTSGGPPACCPRSNKE